MVSRSVTKLATFLFGQVKILYISFIHGNEVITSFCFKGSVRSAEAGGLCRLIPISTRLLVNGVAQGAILVELTDQNTRFCKPAKIKC